MGFGFLVAKRLWSHDIAKPLLALFYKYIGTRY
jgi:hypothetical protein